MKTFKRQIRAPTINLFKQAHQAEVTDTTLKKVLFEGDPRIFDDF